MMVLKYFPIVLTKDTEFYENLKHFKYAAGAVILLPQDAVLVDFTPEDTDENQKDCRAL